MLNQFDVSVLRFVDRLLEVTEADCMNEDRFRAFVHASQADLRLAMAQSREHLDQATANYSHDVRVWAATLRSNRYDLARQQAISALANPSRRANLLSIATNLRIVVRRQVTRQGRPELPTTFPAE